MIDSDRWYTKLAPLFLPKGHYWFYVSLKWNGLHNCLPPPRWCFSPCSLLQPPHQLMVKSGAGKPCPGTNRLGLNRWYVSGTLTNKLWCLRGFDMMMIDDATIKKRWLKQQKWCFMGFKWDVIGNNMLGISPTIRGYGFIWMNYNDLTLWRDWNDVRGIILKWPHFSSYQVSDFLIVQQDLCLLYIYVCLSLCSPNGLFAGVNFLFWNSGCCLNYGSVDPISFWILSGCRFSHGNVHWTPVWACVLIGRT